MKLICVHPIVVTVVASLEQTNPVGNYQGVELKLGDGLTFGEALEVAKLGYGIFREAWKRDYLHAKSYIALCKTSPTGLAEFRLGEKISRFNLGRADLLATDWTIYPEPLTKE